MSESTHKDRIKQAHVELAVKLALEKMLIPTLKRLLKQISKDFKALYRLTGIIINANDYKRDIEAILRAHYRKTTKKFNTIAKDYIKTLAPDIEPGANMDADIQNRIRHLIADDPALRAAYINETNDKDINKYVHDAIILLLIKSYTFPDRQALDSAADRVQEILQNKNLTDENKTRAMSRVILEYGATRADEAQAETSQYEPVITASQAREEISSTVAARLNDNSESRSELIAITETQNSAEKAKQIVVAAFIASLPSEVSDGMRNKKQWIAILDEVTRDAHAAADGQIVDIDEPYTVGGEKLMVPGDTSLGASIWNVARCRCSSMPVIYRNEV